MGWRDVELAIKVAARLEGITTSDRTLWFLLAHHRNSRTGECFPSIDTLMIETGLSRRGVQLSLRHLESLSVLSIIPGGGRVSNRYNLLIHHVDDDKVCLLPIDDLDVSEGVTTPLTRVVSTPLQGSEYAGAAYSVRPCSVVSTPESGSLTPGKETDIITVTGTDQSRKTATVPETVTVMNLHDEHDKTERQEPRPLREIPETPASFKQSVISPFDEEASKLVNYWKSQSTKPVFKQDFIRLLENGGEYATVLSDLKWTVETSDYWMSESPAWNGEFGFDIIGSGAWVTNYPKINQSHYNWLETYKANQAAKEAKVEASRANVTLDWALPPLTHEEKQDVDIDWGDAKIGHLEEAAKPVSTHDHMMDHGIYRAQADAVDVVDGDHELTPADPSADDSDDGEIIEYKQPQEPITKNEIPAPIEDWVDANARRHASIPDGRQGRHQTQRQYMPEPSASTDDEDDYDCEVENKMKREAVAFVDSKDVWEQLAVLKDVWKEISDRPVSLVDFRHILRDNKSAIPEDNPVEYLAAVIRWAMVFWPKRGELKYGSASFLGRFEEIQQDYACAMSKVESGWHKQMFVDPNEDL